MLHENSGESTIFCPLLKKDISETYCYEINSVRLKYAKPSLLNDVISREDMEKFCVTCKYCLYEFLLKVPAGEIFKKFSSSVK
jgi:hypothetical protein